MSERKPPDDALVYLPQDEPIVLVGQPGALHGEVRLHNRGAKRVVLRDAHVRGAPLEPAAAGAAAPVAHTLPPVALRPGQTRHTPLNLAIDPHTPPGEYHGELEVAGHVRQVVLHVTETVQLGISPAQLVMENRAGATVAKRVVFSNRGNVPLTIGAIGPVQLEDEFLQCRTLRGTLAAVGGQKRSLEEYVAEAVRQAGAVLERAGYLRVHNTASAVVLQPGEVRPIDLKIRVPDKLDKHTRYRGTAKFYDTKLKFVVVRSPESAEPTRRSPEREGAGQS